MLTNLLAQVIGLSLLSLSAAQDPPPRPRAVCSTDAQYQWTFNSLGQSPCEVAGDLLDVCLGRNVYIVALDAGQRYPPAQASGEGNDCRCSTIYYSMLSACAYCQGRAWISWTAQTIPNCVATFDRHFPISMPGVNVPSWANLDVVSQGAFDASKARDSLNPAPPRPPPPPPPPPNPTTKPRPDPTTTPRSTPTSANADPPPTSVSRSSTTAHPASSSDTAKSTLPSQSTSTQTLTDSSTPAPPDPSSQTSLGDDAVSDPNREKKKPPIGPIIAGVGGGVLFIAILCGAYVFFLVRRRRRGVYGVGDNVPSTAVSPFLDNPMHGDGRTISPEMSNQLTGTGVSVISNSRSNVYNPFGDGMTERTVSPSGASAQYTNSLSDPSNPYQDHSITKGHHPSPSFTTTLSNSNSTSSPPYHHPQTENYGAPNIPALSPNSSAPLRPVRRVPDDDMQSMRTSTRLSRGGYLPPPYDPDTAPPMPLGLGKS